jgi:hypothetical protein
LVRIIEEDGSTGTDHIFLPSYRLLGVSITCTQVFEILLQALLKMPPNAP